MDKGKVLIVDDDPIVRDVLSDILAGIGGYRTDVAVDGRDGIEKLTNEEYDIVFTDLSMPRMGGMDLLKETRRIVPSLSVVVITSFSTIETAINAMKEGARDFITKPFNVNTVVSIADRIVGERRLLDKISGSRDKEETIGRLNTELFSSLYEIGIFHSISTELDGMFDNREVYQKLVEMASRLLVVKEASFGIIENGVVNIEKGIGVSNRKISVQGTVFETVLAQKNYYIASPGEVNPHNGVPLASPFFSIPFIMNGDVFAVLNLGNKADGTTFTDYEVSLALAFAKKAALRIENNALYEVFYNNLVNTLKTLVTSIEARDTYTKHHSERVVAYSLQIAEVMGLSEEEKDVIKFGGYLHDIGKIGVRDTVLLKPGRLSDEEMAEIRLHPVIGDNIIKPIKFFPGERELIRHHHEDVDGKGYPDGIQGDAIPLIVRILKVADTYDAMTSSRPYRKALSHAVAADELKRFSNSQFDAEVVRAFLQTASRAEAGNEP
jgi:response regulator RpfG family c-di-GMP phosphodiesterase